MSEFDGKTGYFWVRVRGSQGDPIIVEISRYAGGLYVYGCKNVTPYKIEEVEILGRVSEPPRRGIYWVRLEGHDIPVLVEVVGDYAHRLAATGDSYVCGSLDFVGERVRPPGA